MSHRRLGNGAAALAVALLAACTTFAPGVRPGTSIAEARQSFGGVAGEYRLPRGGTRLEFRQGETYTLDFDASGRLVSSGQVLTAENFATIRPGLNPEQVLIRIGHPSYTLGVGYQKLQVWSYRFGGMDGDCVVFQVSISNARGAVSDAGPNTDPSCSGRDRSG